MVGIAPNPYHRTYVGETLSAEDRESTLSHIHRPRLSGRHFSKPKFLRHVGANLTSDRDSTVRRERLAPLCPTDNPHTEGSVLSKSDAESKASRAHSQPRRYLQDALAARLERNSEA